MTPTKLAPVCFVRARNCMRQQVFDDGESVLSSGRSQSATTCDSSYVLQSTNPYWKSNTPVLQSTTKYYSVLQSMTPVLQSTTPVLQSTTQHHAVLQSISPVLQSTTLYYSSTTLKLEQLEVVYQQWGSGIPKKHLIQLILIILSCCWVFINGFGN